MLQRLGNINTLREMTYLGKRNMEPTAEYEEWVKVWASDGNATAFVLAEPLRKYDHEEKN